MDTALRIRDFLLESIIAPGCDVDCNTELYSSGLVDSFGMLEMVSFIESEFSVRVEDYEIVQNNADTISKIAELVRAKKEGIL